MTPRTNFSGNYINQSTKSRFGVVATSYGRNKNPDNEIKNREKAKNSHSYRCAAIKKRKNQENKDSNEREKVTSKKKGRKKEQKRKTQTKEKTGKKYRKEREKSKRKRESGAN